MVSGVKVNIQFLHLDIAFYLTYSFEINEIRCLIQDVISPHCGDNRMVRRCMRRSLPNYFDKSLECETRHSNLTLVNEQKK